MCWTHLKTLVYLGMIYYMPAFISEFDLSFSTYRADTVSASSLSPATSLLPDTSLSSVQYYILDSPATLVVKSGTTAKSKVSCKHGLITVLVFLIRCCVVGIYQRSFERSNAKSFLNFRLVWGLVWFVGNKGPLESNVVTCFSVTGSKAIFMTLWKPWSEIWNK